jgi:hypothetical protein
MRDGTRIFLRFAALAIVLLLLFLFAPRRREDLTLVGLLALSWSIVLMLLWLFRRLGAGQSLDGPEPTPPRPGTTVGLEAWASKRTVERLLGGLLFFVVIALILVLVAGLSR